VMALLARAVLSGAPISPPQLIEVTPTVDRLAEPTLPAQPLQADIGSRVYWLSCMPCHGDKGQGLTAEFRGLYPPDHQNCWSSGCHGEHPYNKGFTLPAAIPPLIGPGALAAFQSAADLQGYIASAMPFWDPGSLTDQQSWQVTAFILRTNGMWQGQGDLDTQIASTIRISTAGQVAGTEMETPFGSATPRVTPAGSGSASPHPEGGWPIVALPLAFLAVVLVIWILLRRNEAPESD
jgi:mono/diheme cytochrome c family protein